jgi:hypothetical protein
MFNLPKNTTLGELKIIHIFQFFDIPRLFLCKNNASNYYLVLSIFDDYETYEWFYLSLSTDRLSSIIAKQVSLRNAYLNPEDGILLRITSDFSGMLLHPIEPVFPNQLKDEDLPEEGVFLDTSEKVAIGFGAIDAREAARSSGRETLNLHLYPDTQLLELGIRTFGSILTSLQKLADAIGQYCEGKPTLKGAIPANIIDATELRATQIFEGSFGIQLKSKQAKDMSNNDIFNGLLMSDVLSELTNLLEAKDNEEDVNKKLHLLKGRVASKYRCFLGDILKLNAPIKVQWGSPNLKRGKDVELSKEELKKIFELVSRVEKEISTSIDFRAELLGLNIKTKWYRVKHLESDVEYEGGIADGAITQVPHSEINGIYEVTLEKIIETNSSSGEEKEKWQLIGLKAID